MKEISPVIGNKMYEVTTNPSPEDVNFQPQIDFVNPPLTPGLEELTQNIFDGGKKKGDESTAPVTHVYNDSLGSRFLKWINGSNGGDVNNEQATSAENLQNWQEGQKRQSEADSAFRAHNLDQVYQEGGIDAINELDWQTVQRLGDRPIDRRDAKEIVRAIKTGDTEYLEELTRRDLGLRQRATDLMNQRNSNT